MNFINHLELMFDNMTETERIITEEMERNPRDWKHIAAQRIDSAYRNKGNIYVKEYSFTNVATLILTGLILLVMIVLGSMLFI